jgi:hypothetical protein
MFLCLSCTPASAQWRHEQHFVGLSRGACECCGEVHGCIDYHGRIEQHDCAYYRGLQKNCAHVWDGISTVGICSKCGASLRRICAVCRVRPATPGAPQRAGTPDQRQTANPATALLREAARCLRNVEQHGQWQFGTLVADIDAYLQGAGTPDQRETLERPSASVTGTKSEDATE